MNARGYVRVRTDDHPIPGDWVATCRLCTAGLTAGDWEACMEWACGHLAFTHEGEWRRRCEHDIQAHGGGRSWCLDCGADTKGDA